MYDPSFKLPRSIGLLIQFTKLGQVFNVSTFKKDRILMNLLIPDQYMGNILFLSAYMIAATKMVTNLGLFAKFNTVYDK